MKTKLLTLFIGIFLVVYSCKKNDVKSTSPTGPVPPVLPTASSPITAPVQGNVFDENNKPVTGVSISIGTKTATTDLYGYFRIDNASLDKYASLLTGQLNGYFKIIKTFAATSGVNYIRIKMIKRNLAGTVTASSGGTVTLSDGSSVTLPANAVIKKSDNSSYTGTINVYAASIDPTSPDISSTMPGNLMGNDSSGKRMGLQSFGILAVELESSAAEPLQIAPGKSATLNFNIPSSLAGTAPSGIPLWYMNDTTGLWQQQGRAVKSGSGYTGTVTHFSFWDADVPVNAVTLNMTVTDASKNPLPYVTVELLSTDYGITYGYTDSLGQVSGLVPFNEQLSYSISFDFGCGNNFSPNFIGPFTTSSSITVVASVNTPTTTLSGTVTNCSSNAVTGGYVLLYHNYVQYNAPIDQNGNFTFRLVKCGYGDSVLVVAVDTAAKQQSFTTEYALDSSVKNIGVISACNGSSVSYANIIYDGTSYSLTDSTFNEGLDADPSQNFPQEWSIECYNYKTQNTLIAFQVYDSGAVGTVPLEAITVVANGVTKGASVQAPPSLHINVNVTEYAATIGQFYAGNFSGNFIDTFDSTTHSISCSFRVRKNHP
jgi:hypothetical protein